MATTKTTLTISEADRAHMDSVVQSGLYVSISDYVRSLIRHDRAQIRETPEEIAAIREKLIRAEQSPLIDETPTETLAGFKEEARKNGLL